MSYQYWADRAPMSNIIIIIIIIAYLTLFMLKISWICVSASLSIPKFKNTNYEFMTVIINGFNLTIWLTIIIRKWTTMDGDVYVHYNILCVFLPFEFLNATQVYDYLMNRIISLRSSLCGQLKGLMDLVNVDTHALSLKCVCLCMICNFPLCLYFSFSIFLSLCVLFYHTPHNKCVHSHVMWLKTD